MSNPDNQIDKCAQALRGATRVVVSTGAGMSKESGIPTFRDAPNALWAEFDPMKLATREGFAADPPLVWRWYADRRRMIAQASPNNGHRAIAELESLADDVVLLTQNIDDLHRKAGSKNVVEIHGNIFRFKCFDRGHLSEDAPSEEEAPPRCHCGSFLRPDVVWFGEMLPAVAIAQAYRALESCDVVLVVGTSGTVEPAASFPLVAKRAGAIVIEVNPEPSEITAIADVFLAGPAGEILPQIIKQVRSSVRE